jgi:hypothetical protein
VEFDDVNRKTLIYSAQDGYAFLISQKKNHNHIDLMVILLYAATIRSLTW